MQTVSAVAQSLEQPSFVYDEPRIGISSGKYVVTLAQTTEEIDAALKLRFEVFNLELGEGLDSSFRTGRDRDQFDATCHHLIVVDQTNGKVVGTYRLRTIEMAEHAEGFYSAGEFDLNYLPPEVLDQSVELGRACIAQSHRNRQVLFLLWKALARYVQFRRKRFLFGCCSVTSQEPDEGHQLSGQLLSGGHMHPTLFVPPQGGYECRTGYSGSGRRGEVRIPQLFRMYLSIGALVCSPPAIDRMFKTIDFLVLFDVEAMDSSTRKLFFAR
jgi:putative hemolysin